MKKLYVLCKIICFSLMLFGCIRQEKVLKVSPGVAPVTLAVLPVNNLSNDVHGAQVFRDLLYKRLAQSQKGYRIMNIEETDRILNEAGITDGGQLSVIMPIELCELLNVDGLLYTDLKNLELLTLPFYHTRKVEAQFRLYSFNQLIWLKSINTNNRYIEIENMLKAIDDPEEGFKRAGESMLVHQGIKFSTIALFGHELRPEMEMTLDNLLVNIPHGSSENSNYLDKVSNRLEDLHRNIEEGKSIVSEEMYMQETDLENVYDDGIIILN